MNTRRKEKHSRNREEQHEHRRFVVLKSIYSGARGGIGREVPLGTLAEDIAISREEAYRIIEFLTRQGLVEYLGAGPRVALTEAGTKYIRNGAGRRRTVR